MCNKRNSLYPGRISNEMKLFPVSKFTISGNTAYPGFVMKENRLKKTAGFYGLFLVWPSVVRIKRGSV